MAQDNFPLLHALSYIRRRTGPCLMCFRTVPLISSTVSKLSISFDSVFLSVTAWDYIKHRQKLIAPSVKQVFKCITRTTQHHSPGTKPREVYAASNQHTPRENSSRQDGGTLVSIILLCLRHSDASQLLLSLEFNEEFAVSTAIF